jgi:hypothetical protein
MYRGRRSASPGQKLPGQFSFAQTNGMKFPSIWGFQRDNGGCLDTREGNTCPGIVQHTWDFSHLLEPFTHLPTIYLIPSEVDAFRYPAFDALTLKDPALAPFGKLKETCPLLSVRPFLPSTFTVAPATASPTSDTR